MTRHPHSFCDTLSLSLPPSTLSPSTVCCWRGSVLGSTCPQNEYTFACISALPWLACYPLCRRVWLMIRACHFSQQPSRPPACAHIKHPNAGRNLEFHLLKHKHTPAYTPYTHLYTCEGEYLWHIKVCVHFVWSYDITRGLTCIMHQYKCTHSCSSCRYQYFLCEWIHTHLQRVLPRAITSHFKYDHRTFSKIALLKVQLTSPLTIAAIKSQMIDGTVQDLLKQ